MNLPKTFIDTVVNSAGKKGEEWLNALSDLVLYFKNKWKLTHLQPAKTLSYNFVIFAYSEEYQEVALKLCLPTHEFEHELKALQFYEGNGTVRLLDFDIRKGALLLERAVPGETIKIFFPEEEDKSIEIAAAVIKKLHHHNIIHDNDMDRFPKIEHWLEGLYKNTETIPEKLLQKARILAASLLSTQSQIVLLHGDLHHENILCNTQHVDGFPYLSIDPKGVLGDPLYEVGAFIRNPIPDLMNHPNHREIIQHRVHRFSTLLDYDEQRIAEWSFVQAVLSACWGNEENNKMICEYMIKCAESIKNFI